LSKSWPTIIRHRRTIANDAKDAFNDSLISVICDLESDMIWCYFAAGKQVGDEALEEMIESGNPGVFTQGVCLSMHLFVHHVNVCTFTDNYRYTTGASDTRRHRGATQWYCEIRIEHSRTVRVVYGYGNACRITGNRTLDTIITFCQKLSHLC
jgi:hypothetical protein